MAKDINAYEVENMDANNDIAEEIAVADAIENELDENIDYEAEAEALDDATEDDYDDVDDLEEISSDDEAEVPNASASGAGNAERPRRRRARRSSQDSVVNDDADVSIDVMSPTELRQLNWNQLKTAQKRGIVNERRIVAVEPATEGRRTPRVVVYFADNLPVHISTRDFFGINLFGADFATADEFDRNRREYQMASKMLGAWIQFVVTAAESVIDPESGTRVYAAVGSRVMALERKRQRLFLGAEPRINVGRRIKARVLMPTSRGVLVEALGNDVLIATRDLSASRWVDPIVDYPAGKVILADVSALEVNKDEQTVKIAVTGRTVDEEDARVAFRSIKVNTRYRGIVVSVDESYARINLNGVGARASVPRSVLAGYPVRYGTQVDFEVKEINRDRMIVYGSCIPVAARTM